MSAKAKILAKGSVLRMIEFFAIAFVTLAMTPFIIHSLGDAMFGLWTFIGSFLGYYGLMDFGLNSAIQRFLSRAIGSSNNGEANKIINTALALFTILGLLTLFFSFIVAFGLPLLIKNIIEVNLFRTIILILGMNFAIGFPLRVFSGILFANIRYDLSTAVELVKLAVRTLLIIIFLKNECGIISLAVITFVIDIIGYVSKYFIVRHLYQYLVFSRKLIDRSLVKPLFGYSVYTFISQIADQLRFNIDNLVITMFIGLSSVTLYSIASRLVGYFMQFMMSAIGMLAPLFSQYEASGNYDSIRDKFIFTTKISGYLSIMVGGTLIIFGKAFIQRWVGIEYTNAYPILLILVIPIILALMQSPSIQLLYGISKHRFFAISNSVEGVANLVLSLILVRKYGLIGVALGTAIPMVIIKLFVQPVYTCRVIKLSIKKYYLEVLGPAILNSGVILILLWFMVKNLITADYFKLSALISVVFVMFTLCVFFLGFKEFERNYFKKLRSNV